MKRTTGCQDLWGNEYIIWYDGQRPYHVVGIRLSAWFGQDDRLPRV